MQYKVIAEHIVTSSIGRTDSDPRIEEKLFAILCGVVWLTRAEQIKVSSVSGVPNSGLPRPMQVGNAAEHVDTPVVGKTSRRHFVCQRFSHRRVRPERPEGSVRPKDAVQVEAASLCSGT